MGDVRPPLSVILPLREGLRGVDALLGALLPQAERTGTEVVIAGPVSEKVPDPARVVRVDDDNLFRLRLAGIEAARGEVVAIGEDHAVPCPDWCEAIIRAHSEHPEASAMVGCLVNATDSTMVGRANFLYFAAPVAPPLRGLPDRPAPASALSFKRHVLEEARGRLGHFETVLVPRLFVEGNVGFDGRIAVDHYQDNGIAWSIVNAFDSARSSYGYAVDGASPRGRAARARWSILHWPPRLVREARAAVREERQGKPTDLALVTILAAATALGGAFGSLTGPGRSPSRVA